MDSNLSKPLVRHFAKDDPNLSQMSKKVTFAEPLVTNAYYEQEELRDDYVDSRRNPYIQWNADLYRFSKVISPVLDQDHRQRVFAKLEPRL